MLFADPESPRMEFADHAAVTPFGSPETLRLMAPLNDPPVETARLAVPADDELTETEFADEVSVNVGGWVTVSAKVSVCVPEASEPVIEMACAPVVADDATERVTVAGVPGVMDAGLIFAVTPAGVLAVRTTAFFPAPLSVMLTVKVAALPASAVPLVAEGVIAKSALCGPPVAGPHWSTSTAPSTDPSPVARLYSPPLAVNPVTPGTLLFPDGVG